MSMTARFPTVPVFALRPGDILGRTEVVACNFPIGGEARITMATGYILTFPSAQEAVVLSAPSRHPHLSMN